jgi:3-oxoacyl-[acyl-carrier protein] reductase
LLIIKSKTIVFVDLKMKDKLFIVFGATSGFGNAIVKALIKEEANVIIVGRRKELIDKIIQEYPDRVIGIEGDVTQEPTINSVVEITKSKFIDGIVLNAGGPLPGMFKDVSMENWDKSYNLLIRWKVKFLQEILPKLEAQQYGRILFIESTSVKQPIENLILSNSLRMTNIGLAKSLSLEYAEKGITVNVLAPGLHDTPALERLIKKRSEINQLNYTEAKKIMTKEIPVKRLGNAEEFASFATWLLSPNSGYITGQTFSIDGGAVKNVFG